MKDPSVAEPRPCLYHIPVCPFSQRLEILLALKGLSSAVAFHVVDITRPRADWLLQKTRGSSALPVLEVPGLGVLRESLVILHYLEQVHAHPPVARRDPYEHAVESMLVSHEGGFAAHGYRFVMNQDPARRDALREQMIDWYARIDEFLREHAPRGPFVFDRFGWAECVFTPLFMRFWFLEYYEEFEVPARLARAREWIEACLAHPAAQQVTREQIVKLYYDYAKGAGNGALPPGRRRSSFAFDPDWRARPWPPRDKYSAAATDAQLGLCADRPHRR